MSRSRPGRLAVFVEYRFDGRVGKQVGALRPQQRSAAARNRSRSLVGLPVLATTPGPQRGRG